MTAQILSIQNEGAKHRVTFCFVDGERVEGPFMEDRPAEEEPQAFVDARIPQPAPDYYALMEGALDGNIGAGTYDAVRRALKDVDAESVNLGSVQMTVTYPEQTSPDDVEAALRSRVDGELGAGKFEAVKSVLRAMGFEAVTLQRKSELSL